MNDYFSKLPSFLKEYIHNSRWTEFREVQTKAFDVLFNTDSHLLLSSGTSSGKTEAAMFPVIASIYSDPPKSIGLLYVSPLKALIDDQFGRLELILRDSDIRVTSWHGEADAGMKERLLREPSGILQITPESLQGLAYGDRNEAKRLFGDLRFIIIDEVHSFLDSDRGIQLLCCLERLERITGVCARRIGLSATISDLSVAESWLSASTGRKVSSVLCPAEQKRIVRLLYNRIPGEDSIEGIQERKQAIGVTYMRMLNEVRGRSSIVFVNSRHTAEITSRSLSLLAKRTCERLEVHTHHGSISKSERKNAEEALKSGRADVTAVATSTLELGVDIGSLDTIVQIGAPYSCSALLQRMGRSGRRGGAQSLALFCNEDSENFWNNVDGVSMELIRSIAMVELALGNNWVEPPYIKKLPYGLLLQQTLAYLKNSVGAKFTELCREVLSLYPFRNIPEEDYRTLVKHMVNTELLDYLQDATLVLGPEGETLAFGKNFPVVFSASRDVEIRFGDKVIGTVQKVPKIDSNILLSGKVWRVVSLSSDGNAADVVESEGDSESSWKSGAPEFHKIVIRKMRDVLFSDETYPYLDGGALARLEKSREAAKNKCFYGPVSRVEGAYRICPWVGSRQFDTLLRTLNAVPEYRVERYAQPYFIDVVCGQPPSDVSKLVKSYLDSGDLTLLINEMDDLINGKYDEYVPEPLLMKAFAADRLDSDFDA